MDKNTNLDSKLENVISYIETNLRNSCETSYLNEKSRIFEVIFWSLASSIHPTIKEELEEESSKLFEREIDFAYYYQPIELYYEGHQQKSIKIITSLSVLWNFSVFSMVFVLLFGRFLFKYLREVEQRLAEIDNNYKKYLTFALKGCERLFQHDLDNKMYRFSLSFNHLIIFVKECKSYEKFWELVGMSINIIGKYSFYYDDIHPNLFLQISQNIYIQRFKSEDSDSEISSTERNWTESKIVENEEDITKYLDQFSHSQVYNKIVDIILTESIKMAKELRSIDLLNNYLDKLILIKDIPLGIKTKNKLQIFLSMFSHPGGPFFPSRPIRNKARFTMDVLFPGGKCMRSLVHYCFRLFHPYYFPFSFINQVLHVMPLQFRNLMK